MSFDFRELFQPRTFPRRESRIKFPTPPFPFKPGAPGFQLALENYIYQFFNLMTPLTSSIQVSHHISS